MLHKVHSKQLVTPNRSTNCPHLKLDKIQIRKQKMWKTGCQVLNKWMIFFFVFEWKICNCSSVDLPDNEKWEDNLHSDETKISIISMSNWVGGVRTNLIYTERFLQKVQATGPATNNHWCRDLKGPLVWLCTTLVHVQFSRSTKHVMSCTK